MRKNGNVVEVAIKEVHRPPHYVHVDGFVGGMLRPDETAEEAARRIITEKTKLDARHIFLTPLKFYDRIDRDKRGRVISIAYLGIMDCVAGATDDIKWVPVQNVGRLAYDHNEMRDDMLLYMKDHLFITNIALHFMPKEFTIANLKALYEYLLGHDVDKRNFYKFVEGLPLQATKTFTKEGRGRPAMLYKKLATKAFFLP